MQNFLSSGTLSYPWSKELYAVAWGDDIIFYRLGCNGFVQALPNSVFF